MEIEKLEKQRDQEITGFFWLGLQIAFIFGIPAFLAVFISKKIILLTGNKNATTIALVISFILSWVIVFIIYQKKSKKLKIIEDNIKKLRKEANNKYYMFRISREITQVTPDTILMIGNFKISNSTITSILILIMLSAFCYFVIRKFKINPDKKQTAFELLVESMLNLIEQITGSAKHAKVIFPLIASLFLYIGISNLISIIPGLMSITYDNYPIFRSPTSDFNTTFGLAIGSVFLTNIISISDWGFFGHLGKFIKFKEVYLGFKDGLKSGLMSIIDFAIGLLDIVGELAKVVSLSLRLFGNMYAGEILAGLILGAFAYAIPILWTAMSLLSGVIQAIVFGSLTTAYYMLAVKIKEGEEGT